MLQIKLITGGILKEWIKEVNLFLATLPSDAVKDIELDKQALIALISYQAEEEYTNRLCCDCQHWDDGGSPSATGGLCHECGGRRRFNAKACKYFKDIREATK